MENVPQCANLIKFFLFCKMLKQQYGRSTKSIFSSPFDGDKKGSVVAGNVTFGTEQSINIRSHIVMRHFHIL
jgi:hypothetical protein